MTAKKQLRWLHKKPGEMLGAETRSVSIRKVRDSQKWVSEERGRNLSGREILRDSGCELCRLTIVLYSFVPPKLIL